MRQMLRLAESVALAVFLAALGSLSAAPADKNVAEDADQPSTRRPKPTGAEADNRQRQSAPRIMVVVPEILLGQPRVPDPAGETELIRRLVEADLCVLDSSEVALIRYSDEMGHIIREADVRAMRALCNRYRCDLLIAGEAFSEQVNERPAHDVVPVTARARIEVKAFVVETGEILAANAAVADATDFAPAVAGKTALQNAAAQLAGYLVPRIQTAIEDGRVRRALPPEPPYVLYGVAGGMAALVLIALILAVFFQQRAAAETAQTQTSVDRRLTGQVTYEAQSPKEK